MLKVYGTKLCPDCIAFEASFKKYGIDYQFVNIFESMPKFKEFLRLRDQNPAFAEARKAGNAGIPAIIEADGSVNLDWEGYLKARGFEPIWPKEADEQMAKIEAEKDACAINQVSC